MIFKQLQVYAATLKMTKKVFEIENDRYIVTNSNLKLILKNSLRSFIGTTERTLWCISFQNGWEDTCKAKDVLHLGLLDHPIGWLQSICTKPSNRNYLHLMLSPLWLLVAPTMDTQDTRLSRDGVDSMSKILDKMWHTMLSTHMQDEEKIDFGHL